MQDNMILEQEQLLFAIDDIDDAQLMAEAAVISKMVDLYVHQAMVQEAMVDDEAFESYFQEANEAAAQDGAENSGKSGKLKGKFAAIGEKIKNFDAKEMLRKIATALKNIFSTLLSNFVKFIKHFKPSYLAQLVRVKTSEIARIAKKEGCKLHVNTDGSVTLMFLMPDFGVVDRWLGEVSKYIKYMTDMVDKAAAGGGMKTRLDQIPRMKGIMKYADKNYGQGDADKKFPKTWTKVSDFVAKSGREIDGGGGTKTSITGKETKFDGIMQKLLNLVTKGPNGDLSDLGKLRKAIEKLPATRHNVMDAEGNDTGRAKSGHKSDRNAEEAVVKLLVDALNDVYKQASALMGTMVRAYNEAVQKADKITAQLKDKDSELWSKTKRGKAMAANKEAYDEAIGAASELKGKKKKEATAAADEEYAKAKAATDSKFAKHMEREGKVTRAIDFDDR